MVASAPQSFAHDLLIGKPIAGRYRVVRLLGEGGMGAVYEARPIDGSETVAIKVLAAQYAVDDVSARRFMQEAEAAARIAHPNIAYVTQMGREPSGALYIVQELLRGEDARTILQRRGTLSVGEAIAIALPVASALDAAHKHGILHRDVKPENIFITTTPNGAIPKLIDFGISKFQDAQLENDKRTQTGVAIGTPDYMSPEQARADRALDGRTDQWSLATVLFELLTARPPYVAQTATLVLTKIITEQPPRIELFMPDIPPAIATVIHRALETDRDKRYRDMAAFADALSKAAHDSGVTIDLPEVFVHGEDEPVRRRSRVASAEVRTPGLPKAPSSADGSNEPPTTLFTAPTTHIQSPSRSPLSAPPAAAPPAQQPQLPSVVLDDSAFVDPRRGLKVIGTLVVLALLAAIGVGGWYVYSERARANAATTNADSTPHTQSNATPHTSTQQHESRPANAQRPSVPSNSAHPDASAPSAGNATTTRTSNRPQRTRVIRHIRRNGLTIQRQYREQ
ncbi:MAG: serine/threonine protein kinase [Myxococcales bacterium]|nr:serine/threonine protein kinase [Myxococcales bacterium]